MTNAMTATQRYLETFFAEKDLPLVQWEITGDDGAWNLISNEVVIETILTAARFEQEQIARMLRRLDFANADVNHFLRHLAGALVNRGVAS